MNASENLLKVDSDGARLAQAAVDRLAARIADDLPPKENLAAGGPRPTPVPQSKTKKRRRTGTASRLANRPRRPTRRQRRRRVAPRSH
jgi:hypothetical protein